MIQPDILINPSIADHIETKIPALNFMFLNITLCGGYDVFLFGRCDPGFGRAEFIGSGRLDLDKDDGVLDFTDYIDFFAFETITLFQNLIAFIGEILNRQFLGLIAEPARPRVSQEGTAPEGLWLC